MPADLSPYAETEDAFAQWCGARDLYENDEAWRAYEAWISDIEWQEKYGEDPTGYGEPFTGDEVDPHPFGGEAA